MANTGVKGRIVDAETNNGIPNLTVKVIDFVPLFHEDEVLATGKTNDQGNFQLTYSAEAYNFWRDDIKPNLVVQVLGPGNRLLFESEEVEDVAVETLEIPLIKLHSNHLDGWLVTHTTLKPEDGTPVALFKGNKITHLVDGAEMFPAVTQAAIDAQTSINLMTLFFTVDSGLITQFKPTFNHLNPPSSNCKDGKQATLEEELKKKPATMPVNVMVTNVPLSASDTVTEVNKFFKNTNVKTNDFSKGFALLHSKAIITDGDKAILMGSPLKQTYFSDGRHSIHDARHKGSLHHDVNIQVEGPAAAKIDQTFVTVWKAKSQNLTTITPNQIPERTGSNIASVQVLRTLPGNTFKAVNPGDEDLPHGETGILEAYQRAIHLSERFIYIETQYFTSVEIIDALITRMKDDSKPKLQIIMVLNFRPDLPGYPDRQIDNVNKLKSTAKAHGHQIGVYTLWSRLERGAANDTHFEIMPIYVHAKIAIIDDKWGTVGSANLDGTSLNYHEIGLIASGVIAEKLINKIKPNDNFIKFLWDSYWYLALFMLNQVIFNATALLAIIGILIKVIKDLDEVLETLTEITEIPDIMRDVFARDAEHALPSRSRQPSRSVEMNVVMYNGIAGQPETPVIQQLREKLWLEHLGLESLPANVKDVPQNVADMQWVKFWDDAADANLEAIKTDQPLPATTTNKLLKWQPESDAEDYLKAHKIRTKHLRNQAEVFDFDKCKIVDKKKLLPWPII